MTNQEFQNLCIKSVKDYYNTRVESTDKNGVIEDNNIFIVWMCKTLQNHKALVSTTVSDGMYYELTYNGDKNELYLDAYKKWQNICIDCSEIPEHIEVDIC